MNDVCHPSVNVYFQFYGKVKASVTFIAKNTVRLSHAAIQYVIPQFMCKQHILEFIAQTSGEMVVGKTL